MLREGSHENSTGKANSPDRREPSRLDEAAGSQQQSELVQLTTTRFEGRSVQEQPRDYESIKEDAKRAADARPEHDSADSDSQWESESADHAPEVSDSNPQKTSADKKAARRPKQQARTRRATGPRRNVFARVRHSKNPRGNFGKLQPFVVNEGPLELERRIQHEIQKAVDDQRAKQERTERIREEVRKEVHIELLEEQIQNNHREGLRQGGENSRHEPANEADEPMGDAEFRDRVRQRFGHSVEELRSLLTEHAEEMGAEAEEGESENMWIKIDRQYLHPDTLMAYGLPWEWDKDDPNFIIIQKYLSPTLSEELFEHTRRLRARQTTLSTMNDATFRSRRSTFGTRHFTNDSEMNDTTYRYRHSPYGTRRFTNDSEMDYAAYKPRYSPRVTPRFTNNSNTLSYSSSRTVEVEEDDKQPEYRPPECEETGEPLSFDVNMKLRVAQNTPNDTHNFLRQTKFRVEGVEIASSRISGHGKIDLYRKDTTMDSQSTQLSWIHMEREARTFDEFIKFASQAPGLLKQDTALIYKLLDKARAGLRPAHDGGHLGHFVIRSDGRDPSGLNQSVEQKSAIFMCFPFFSVESVNKLARGTEDPSISRTRGLLQTYYHLEATRQRDLEQAVRKTGQYPKHHIVHVPQLWAVVFSSRCLITCSSVSFANTGAHSLNIMDPPKPQFQAAPSIIRLTDHLQRVFFVPMEHCRTWFALMDRIKNHCLSDINFSGRDCQLFTPDNKPVKSGDWQTITTNHTSSILRLDIRLVILEAPELPRFSDQRGARHHTPYRDSDDSSLDEDDPRLFVRQRRSMAVVRRVPTWAREERTETALIIHGAPKRSRLNKTSSDLTPSIDGGAPLNRAVRRPVPPASGIIVNVEPPSDTEDSGNIYFKPIKASDAQNSKASSRERIASPPRDAPRATQGGTDRLTKDIGHDISAAPGDPVNNVTQHKDEAEKSSSPSDEEKFRLNVPPVFTWATGKKPKADIALEPGGPAQSTQKPDEDDVASAEEETLIYVCEYIHAQLTDAGEEAYEDVSPHPLRGTEEVVQQLFKSTVSDLIIYASVPPPTEPGTSGPLWQSSLRRAAGFLFKFLGFFLPMDYRCEVGDRYLGAVSELLIVLSHLCDVSQTYDTVHRVREEFEIVDLSDPNDADLRGPRDMEMLKTPITACIKCYESDKYSNRQAALDHLRSRHFRSALPFPDLNSNWIMDFEQRLNLCCRRDAEKIISLLLDHCAEFEKMMSEIQHGVSENGKFDRDTYRISPCLVDAFKYLLMMVIYGSELAKSVLRNRIKYRGSDIPLTFFNPLYQQQLVTFGALAEGSMEKAMEQILLMAITDDTFDIGGYQAVSPEFILLTLMGDLRSRDSANKKLDLIMVYVTYMRRLQFQVSQYPHHRLLRDLRFVIEELDIIRNMIQKQRLLFANYRNLLDPSSFRVTTESRKSAFAIEENKLDKFIGDLDYDIDLIDHLIKRAESLARQTQSGVEVRQEDHGKAIMVFTIVTVVFLPLSFVTSYFGMNTVDIRDMGSTQSLFWAISIPLAVVIITFALVVGFKADDIREALLSQSWSIKSGKLSRTIPTTSDSDLYHMSLSTISSKSHETHQGWTAWVRQRRKDKLGVEETVQQVV